MRDLIITGDDFGASSQVNEEIERLHREGALTQASLMVEGPAVEEALRIAGRNPSLSVGLHLVVCEESPAWNGWRIQWDDRCRVDLDRDIARQFEAFQAHGLDPTYWDGHMHMHLHPAVFAMALPVAATHGFKGMRLVREKGFHPLAMIFRALSHTAARRLAAHQMRYVSQTFGLRRTGRVTNRYAREVLDGLPHGLSEFYFHPGAEPERIDGRLLASIALERGIQLCNLHAHK